MKKKNSTKNAVIGTLIGLGICAAVLPGAETTDETTAPTQAVAQLGTQANNSETEETLPGLTEYASTEAPVEETFEIVSTTEVSTEYVPVTEAPTEPPTEISTTAAPTEAPTQAPPATEAPAQTEAEEEIVYITATGKKYHRSGCRHLKDSKIEIPLDDAIAQDYEPCKVCNP